MEVWWKKLLKIIVYLLIIITIPFIFPLLTRLLIHLHVYSDVNEFEKYLNIFLNPNFLIFIAIVVIGIFIFTSNKENIMNWLDNRDFFFKHRDTEANIKKSEMVDESAKRKNIINEFNVETDSNNKSTLLEVKKELKKGVKNKSVKEVDESDLLKKENDNLRFYSAYNIINKKAKELLHTIYCEKSIDLLTFRNGLIYSFKNRNKRNKNLTKSQINEYANNKYETIKEGLQYLNIIEISDDDKITLTKYGKEFVEKYIENEVGEDED